MTDGPEPVPRSPVEALVDAVQAFRDMVREHPGDPVQLELVPDADPPEYVVTLLTGPDHVIEVEVRFPYRRVPA